MTITTKPELRKILKPLRSIITDEQDENGANALLEADISALKLSPSSVIAAYYPIRRECNCLPLIKSLHHEGFKIALPVIHGDELPLTFKQWAPEDSLAKGQMSIPEPQADAPDLTPDILFLPLLAFDKNGNRLGYGKGHYDRTLANLKKHADVVTVGIAYDFQEVPEIQCDEFDQRLDWILTPTGLRKLG